MRPVKIYINPENIDPNGIAATSNSAIAVLALNGILVVDGVFTSADGLGRQIAITDTATTSQATATFTINGTNANGETINDDVVGPASGATVLSAKQFLTVTSITIDTPASGGTVDVGTTGIVESKPVPVNWMEPAGCTTAIMGAAGTFSTDIEETFDLIMATGTIDADFWAKQTAKSADGAFTMTGRATGVRVKFASYTNGAEFYFHVLSSLAAT